MEIKIDTSKDSKEEIRKAIRFLQGLVESEGAAQELPSSGENMMGSIFDLPSAGSDSGLPSDSMQDEEENRQLEPAKTGEEKKKPKEAIKYEGFEVY